MEMLAEIVPLDAVANSRVTLRACSAMDKRITALNGIRWWPSITRKASLSHDFFDGDFSGTIATGGASFELSMSALKRMVADAPAYRFAKAAVTLYAADPATAWPWPVVFKGVIERFENRDEKMRIECAVDTTPFEVPALTLTYAGTGGAEGSADLKNKVKPWAFGAPKNVEPVLIDITNSVYQVSAYGPINGITAVYERAASFGASTGDHATYAALVAASIPPGRWATCLAAGMFRLGAPANNGSIITADVEGDKPSGTWLRRTGAIISRILANAGVSSGAINAASLAALDTAVPRNVSFYLTEQTRIIDMVQRMVRPCNAAAGVSWTGELFVCRFGAIGTPAVTLDAQGRQLPPVSRVVEQAVSVPFCRIEMGGNRCWRVHGANEIAFFAEIIEKGDYAGGTSYREGNIVTNQGARWLYINPTASSGNAPPTLPTTTNSYWDLLTGRTDYADVGGTKPPSNADNTASQTIVSKLSPTTGNALDNFVASDGIPFSRIVASGEARDGDAVAFPVTYASVPQVSFSYGGNAATAGQNIKMQAESLTASGFTMRAKSQAVTAGSTITDTGSTSGSGAEPPRVMNRTNSGAPFDGRFVFTYTVIVGNIAPGEPGSITVGIYCKISGSWVQVGSADHGASGSYSAAVTPGTVDFGGGNEFGVGATYTEGSGTGVTAFGSVVYQLGTVTETSLTPTGASPIKWEARL